MRARFHDCPIGPSSTSARNPIRCIPGRSYPRDFSGNAGKCRDKGHRTDRTNRTKKTDRSYVLLEVPTSKSASKTTAGTSLALQVFVMGVARQDQQAHGDKQSRTPSRPLLLVRVHHFAELLEEVAAIVGT